VVQKTDSEKKTRRDSGSIKVINGRLYARLQYICEITKKRKEKLKPAANRTEAKKLIAEMRDDLKNKSQKVLESDKMTFRDVAERYEKVKLIKPVFRKGRKVAGARSFENQKYLLKPLIAHFDQRLIRDIKPSDLESFKNKRLDTDVVIEKKIKKANPKKERRKFIWEKVKVSRERTIASVNRELSLLRQIFVFAESEDYIPRNPFTKAKKIISTAAEVCRDRVVSVSEELLLLNACETPNRQHLRAIIVLAVDSGMRRGEILKLIWEDIDLHQAAITIKATNSKTEKLRKIGMTPRVKAELSNLWEMSPKHLKGSVFGIRFNFNRSWRSILRDIGISDLHFHDLRHTAITRMVRSGISASEVMKISGHSEMKTFLRYMNLTSDSVSVAASRLDAFNAAQRELNQSEIVSDLSN
jgi:integrase